jgi:hypothetical protein
MELQICTPPPTTKHANGGEAAQVAPSCNFSIHIDVSCVGVQICNSAFQLELKFQASQAGGASPSLGFLEVKFELDRGITDLHSHT